MSNRWVARFLRVCWIGLCFVPCLLVIALWVRSYWWSDLLRGHAKKSPIEIISSEGRLKITRGQQAPGIAGIAGHYDAWQPFDDGRNEAQTMASHVRSFKTWAGIGIVP